MPTVVLTRVHHVHLDLLVVFEFVLDLLKVITKVFERVVVVNLLEFQPLSIQLACVTVGFIQFSCLLPIARDQDTKHVYRLVSVGM